MLISAYIFLRRRFCSAMSFISAIKEASITRQVMLASPRGHAAELGAPFVETRTASQRCKHRLPASGIIPCLRHSSETGTPPSACFKMPMTCASLNRPFFIQNPLRYLAEKTLLMNTTNFRGDYPPIRPRGAKTPRCTDGMSVACVAQAVVIDDSPITVHATPIRSRLSCEA